MSITEQDPLAPMAARRDAANRRQEYLTRQHRLESALASAASTCLDVDPVGQVMGCWWDLWRYQIPAGEDERSYARAWLARHARGILTICRAVADQPVRLDKIGGDGDYGVSTLVRLDGAAVSVRAVVHDDLVCELRPTGETRVVPAVPERTEQVMERICPDSIFAGIEREAVAS